MENEQSNETWQTAHIRAYSMVVVMAKRQYFSVAILPVYYHLTEQIDVIWGLLYHSPSELDSDHIVTCNQFVTLQTKSPRLTLY